MKIFQCGHCHHPLFFENHQCENCRHLSGFRDVDRMMLTFNDLGSELISDREQIRYKYCKNKEHGVCNWLLEIGTPEEFCSACQLNRTIPDLSDQSNFPKWQHLEIAKHRLIYQLQKIGLPLLSKEIDDHGICFDFVTKEEDSGIMTGHANGVITILLREADSVIREQTRRLLNEPYRTLIGHLRHEVGHYFWGQLVFPDQQVLHSFRRLFGNEETDYGDSLKAYYQREDNEEWREQYITKYASAHPWEDWAVTWAHYLHVMDMVETAHFIGLKVNPTDILPGMEAEVSFDPYGTEDFETIVKTSVPVSYAVNSINRAMGLPDVYPFVITPAVIKKMTFIHQLLWPKRNFKYFQQAVS